MKVVYINTSDSSGGAAIACLRLQQAMERHAGVSGKVLVQEQKKENPAVVNVSGGTIGRRLAWLRFVGERLLFLPYERSRDIRFVFNRAKIGMDISRHPLVREADVIHLHWINFGFLSVQDVKKLLSLGKPVVWTFHDMWPFTGGCHHSGDCDHYEAACGHCKFLKNPSEDDISRSLWQEKNEAFKNGFASVACSHWLENRAKRSSLLSDTRVLSIPNPIDTDAFKPVSKIQAREKFSLPPHKEFILFAAMRVSAPGKGFGYFVEALKILAAEHPEWTDRVALLVFGQASEDILEGMPFPAFRLGHLSDTSMIVQAYNAASMFVTPSLEENLPNTIMESFACGTPAVGFSVGGIPEMIDHERNGFVSEYRSAASLAKGIHWVLENNQAGELSASARKKALKYYAEPVVAKQYLDLYQSLL